MPKKIIVPEGMLSAGIDAWSAMDAGYHDQRAYVTEILTTALHWLSRNPIMPTDQQLHQLCNDCPKPLSAGWSSLEWYLSEWQRRMSLASEPNPIVLKMKTALAGCTLTRGEANDLINRINECTHG